MTRLRSISGTDRPFEIELGDTITIGRARTCDIRLDDPAISRLHARITRVTGGYQLVHLGSSTPSFVNDMQVTGMCLLASGDVVQIGDLSLLFQDEDTTAIQLRRPAGIPAAVTLVQDAGDSAPQIVRALSSSSSMLEGDFNSSPELARLVSALKTVNALSRQIAHILDVEELLTEIASRVLDVFSASRAVILVKNEEQRLQPRAVKHREGSAMKDASVSETILDHVCAKREAAISRRAWLDERFRHGVSVHASRLQSIMCAPLIWRDDVVGALYLDKDMAAAFVKADLALLIGIADQCAAALGIARLHGQLIERERLAQDLRLARTIQRSFLPQGPPDVPGFEFSSMYEAARQVGGDFYDFIPLSEDRWAIVIGDVSGKGVGAALRMAATSRDLRFCAAADPSPVHVLEQMNRFVIGAGVDNVFVTMLYALLDVRAAELQIANAGHMPPILRRARGRRIEVLDDVSGLPLGIDADAEFQAIAVHLDEGDTAVFFTDGFTEAMNRQKEMLGMERLVEALGSAPAGARSLHDAAVHALVQHVGKSPRADDTTLVCIERKPRR